MLNGYLDEPTVAQPTPPPPPSINLSGGSEGSEAHPDYPPPPPMFKVSLHSYENKLFVEIPGQSLCASLVPVIHGGGSDGMGTTAVNCPPPPLPRTG